MTAWYPFREPSSGEGWAVGDGCGDNGWWCGGLRRSQAEALATAHNATLEEARAGARQTVPDVEAWATRILAGAIREVLREARPRWWRRVTAHRSTGGDKAVYEGDR